MRGHFPLTPPTTPPLPPWLNLTFQSMDEEKVYVSTWTTPVTRQREWRYLPGVEIDLGRGYLDIHLHWGEGGLREPMAREERGTRGSGLKNSHPVSRIL